MDRLTERKTSCWIKTKSKKDYTNYTQDWEAINKLAHYEDLEEQLKKVYGECDGLLETVAKHLIEHPEVEIGNPQKARLLTDEDVDKWERWKEADKEGRLLEFLCCVGDILYKPTRNFISEYRVVFIEVSTCNCIFFHTSLIEGINDTGEIFNEDCIGKTVFLTHEEAEAKLKEMEKK
ncbi:hypothetical protein H8S37_04185 [Mediterraneibacter sp. NSJ-55]|uniref:Uncharacterized protein n=1 Tax=Mediterraneibacter hominis TaxID=2763054 RepID=A0A923LG66_9FIRM|nr:hypothetical protein [Mediterraneibacter hominis]MBC5688132.1 hypothetical protein [Mediterraneibacter hominis]